MKKSLFFFGGLFALIAVALAGKYTNDRCGHGCTVPSGPRGEACGKPCVKSPGHILGHRCQMHALKGS